MATSQVAGEGGQREIVNADRQDQASLWIEIPKPGEVTASLLLPKNAKNPAAIELAMKALLGKLVAQQDQFYWSDKAALEIEGQGDVHETGLRRSCELNTAPLLVVLKAEGVRQLEVELRHPDRGYSDCPEMTQSRIDKEYISYHLTLDVDKPMTLHLTYGYNPSAFVRLSGLPLVLAIPIVLTLWRRRRLYSPGELDRFEVWFSYWRFQKKLEIATWILWGLALLGLGVLPVLGLLLRGVLGDYPFALIGWLPPIFVNRTCQVLGHPQHRLVSEIGWTKAVLFRRSFWGGLATLLGAIGFLVAFRLWHNHEVRWAVLAGFGFLVLLTLAAMKGNEQLFAPGQVLPDGAIKERLAELGESRSAGKVSCQLLPMPYWRLLNVFGRPKTIYLSAELPSLLTERELDAIMAHELASVTGGRLRTLGWGFAKFWAWLIVSVALGVTGAIWQVDIQNWLPLVVIPFVILALFDRLQLRHFSPRTDFDATRMTGDPEAMLTALAKLRRLHLLPLPIGKDSSAAATDPARWPRLVRLADRSDIPIERLEEILTGAGTGVASYPPFREEIQTEAAKQELADSDMREPLVYSKEMRKKFDILSYWIRTLETVFVPALAAFLAQEFNQIPWLVGLLLLGGLFGTPALWNLLLRLIGVSYQGRIYRRLQAKLRRQGVSDTLLAGTFVGFGPDKEPLIYDQCGLEWDLGFLTLGPEQLTFVGERARFTLFRSHIGQVQLVRDKEFRFRPLQIYLTWKDQAGDAEGTLHLFPLERSPWSGKRAVERFAESLRKWHEKAPVVSALSQPPPATTFSLPTNIPATGKRFSDLVSLSALAGMLWLTLILAIGAALIVGFSFDLESGPYLLYVVATALIADVWRLWPLVRRFYLAREEREEDDE